MSKRKPTTLLVLLGLSLSLPTAVASASQQNPIASPQVVVRGVPFSIELGSAGTEGSDYRLELSARGRVLLIREGSLPDRISDLTVDISGPIAITLQTGGATWRAKTRSLPGFLTLLPPLLAIVMALILRQVVVALFAGVWLGAFLLVDFRAVRSFFYVVDHYVIDSLAGASGADHVSIAIFTLMLGGMVGVFTKMGGTQGIVEKITTIATNPRRGQIATWLMGVLIFFDDYTNTLIVGNTMRPLTDKLRISREKLSYIVDATAAPVACIGIISSWIGFEVSLIKDSFDAFGIDRNPFTTFVSSIRYSYYPIFTLAFGLLIAVTKRDFGPMLRAERRARQSGQVLSEKAVPLSSIDAGMLAEEGKPKCWYNAVIPIAVVVAGTIMGLIITGRSALLQEEVGDYSIIDIFRESNSFQALLWSSLSGCALAVVLALGQRLLSLTEAMSAWVEGVKSMVMAIIILVLAWCIGAVCNDLHTADYLVAKVSGVIYPHLLPAIIFATASAISFSTGTSWGTMTILTPITIPLAVKVLQSSTLSPSSQEDVLLAGIAAVLAGSVFGDHCSPISDTTIMSSMASAADHVDHVRTQLPYAMVVALVAMLVGYLPLAYGLPTLAVLALGIGALALIIMTVGKKDSSHGG